MKYLAATAFSLLLMSGGAWAQDDGPPIPEEQQERGAASISQHLAVSITLARLYCEQQIWPKSLEQIEQFLDNSPTPMPVKIDWAWLAGPAVVSEFGDQITLKTPGGEGPGDISVTSTNSRPECNDNEVQPNVHLHLGG